MCSVTTANKFSFLLIELELVVGHPAVNIFQLTHSSTDDLA